MKFLEKMTEEVLNEAFDIKSIANAFFKKHPDLLTQVKDACKNKKSIKPIHIDRNDFNIMREIYVNKNKNKARQLIKDLYTPKDNKYSYMMQLLTINEGKIKTFLLSLAFALAMAAGMLTGCSLQSIPGSEEYSTEYDSEIKYHTIEYKVTSKSLLGVTVEYVNDSHGLKQLESNVKLPWSYTYKIIEDDYENYYLMCSATTGNVSKDVTIEILYDGNVIETSSVFGRWKLARTSHFIYYN